MSLFLTIVIFLVIVADIVYISYNYSERIRLEQELAYWKQAFNQLKINQKQQKSKCQTEKSVLEDINKIINQHKDI